MIVKKSLLVALFAALTSVGVEAASITLNCSAPTTRVDGSSLALNEIATYQFYRNSVSIGSALSCNLVQTIPAGTCVKATDVHTVTVTDKDGQVSPQSTGVSLTTDLCTPKAKPSALNGLVITGVK